jgi:hypothetical protein
VSSPSWRRKTKASVEPEADGSAIHRSVVTADDVRALQLTQAPLRAGEPQLHPVGLVGDGQPPAPLKLGKNFANQGSLE